MKKKLFEVLAYTVFGAVCIGGIYGFCAVVGLVLKALGVN